MTSLGPSLGQSAGSASSLGLDDGPFTLRSLLEDVPLSEDGSHEAFKINCVDYFDGHLYVGTSASELLHFFLIPPDPEDKNSKPTYILASRLKPAYAESSATGRPHRGVQQICLLPRVSRACVLCNGTVTFYSLPELSPLSTNQAKNCNSIGGIDLNQPLLDDGTGDADGVILLLHLNRRIQVVRLREDAQLVKNIDFAGSAISVRRDSIACVADSSSYALLDVQRQLKIPLMSISSSEHPPSPQNAAAAQSLSVDPSPSISRSVSSAQNRRSPSAHSHARSTSLGGPMLGATVQQPHAEGQSLATEHSPSPRRSAEITTTTTPADKPLPDMPSRSGTPSTATVSVSKPNSGFLKPHIASPSSEEFLLVIGTSPGEPGIGMFVNLDGDPTRPTLEFERYPKDIVVDATTADMSSSGSALADDYEGFILASLARESDAGFYHGLEIQRLDAGSDSNPKKQWLVAPGTDPTKAYGISKLVDSGDFQLDDVVTKLCQRRFSPFQPVGESSVASLKGSDSRTALSMERLSKEKELFERDFDSQDDDSLPEGWETTRNAESEEFARRLARVEPRLAVWSGNSIWWAIRNPLIMQLDARLDVACHEGIGSPQSVDKHAVFSILESIRGQDAKTELEFMTFGYIRQKAGLALLTNLLNLPDNRQFSDAELSALDELLLDSTLDPRIVLSLIPGVRNEIVEGRQGIWIYGGVKQSIGQYLQSDAFLQTSRDSISDLEPRTLHFVRRFLTSWRRMKGFGSVADEHDVFRSVDAALLLVLLELDRHSPKAFGTGSTIRSELNDLVDKGVDCFDRAVDLLESYHRLFVLSRLYQSRKMAGDVLATWKRIIEGEQDDGQELDPVRGEQRVRDYLTKISSHALVQEYGVWLANRNPRLGVEVFAEDKKKAPKFSPTQAVEILRAEAPDAVRYYLEYLVFEKGQTGYVNELIAYYLQVVIGHLKQSSAARETVMATYEAYRALQAPKPTYRHFLEDNTPKTNEVWQSRLRLLQLLSGSHDYDIGVIRDRMSSLPEDLLVPEMITLAGKESNHEIALRLLVHKLGDYDTAVSYCLRGGSSTDLSAQGTPASRPTLEQQCRLFRAVLREFLAIDDASDRIEQTGSLLERFGGWYEVDDVLGLIPDTWSVDIVGGFLTGALRRLVQETQESSMVKALSGAENLRVSYDLVVAAEEKGPSIEAPS